MPRPVRGYTYELCDSHLPHDVILTLEDKPWIRQGYLIGFARTAIAAKALFVDLGLRGAFESLKPRLAQGSNFEILVGAGLNREGYVYAISSNSGAVASVHFNSEGTRAPELIGEIDYYGRVFKAVSS